MTTDERDEIAKAVRESMLNPRNDRDDCIGKGIDKAMMLGYIKGYELVTAYEIGLDVWTATSHSTPQSHPRTP